MARHTLWHNPTLARWLPHLNAFPVDRDRPDRKSIRTALDYLDKGFPLVLFPEGTRSPDGRLAPAEPGLALLVQKSGAPVVPVALIGPETVLGPGMKRPRRAKIKVVFGRPIFFTPDSSREEILTHTMEAIAQLMTEHGRPMQPASRSEAPASAESAVPED
jgi:1-acyl-sn-glycerol-3-phosphate acyltransferase